MKKLGALIMLTIMMLGCNNNDKTSKISSDFCDCFEPVTEDMDPKSKRILVKAFNDESPQEVIETELGKIEDEGTRETITNEIREVATFADNSKLQKCINDIKKNYKIKDIERKQAREIAVEMEDVDDCEVAAAIWKSAAQGPDPNANDSGTREENEKENEQ